MLFSRAETKRLLCFRPLRQRQKQSLPATRPSQVGWLRSEWRSPIGRPDHPYRCFKCASFETQLSKATLILKGKQLMEGYKGRWSETEEGGRANQLTQRQSMGRQQYAQASWRPAAKECLPSFMRLFWQRSARLVRVFGSVGISEGWQQNPHTLQQYANSFCCCNGPLSLINAQYNSISGWSVNLHGCEVVEVYYKGTNDPVAAI